MSVSIPSPHDLLIARQRHLREIAQSGRLDDVLNLLNAAIENKTWQISLTRPLTEEEYRAIQHVFNVAHWKVRYTFTSWITGRFDRLKVSQAF